MRVYLRTPVGRYLTREREQRRKDRADYGLCSVHFDGPLSTDIRVLTEMPNSGEVNPFALDACRVETPVSPFAHNPGWYVTEHDYTPDPHVIWQTPIPTIFAVEQLMNLPLVAKRVPIDEVERENRLRRASVRAVLWR